MVSWVLSAIHWLTNNSSSTHKVLSSRICQPSCHSRHSSEPWENTRSRPERFHSHKQNHMLGEGRLLAQVQVLLHAPIAVTCYSQQFQAPKCAQCLCQYCAIKSQSSADWPTLQTSGSFPGLNYHLIQP